MNQQAQHQQQDRRALLLIWMVLCFFLALTLWGGLRLDAGSTIVGFICSSIFCWVLWLHYEARAQEAVIMAALGKIGYLTIRQIISLVAAEIRPCDVYPAIVRLEDRGLIVRRMDPDLGLMFQRATNIEVPV